jgi:hypothetical protein
MPQSIAIEIPSNQKHPSFLITVAAESAISNVLHWDNKHTPYDPGVWQRFGILALAQIV